MIDDCILDHKLLDRRQPPGFFASTTITECVVVSIIWALFYKHLHSGKQNVQNRQIATQQREERYLNTDFFNLGKMLPGGPGWVADANILDYDPWT